MEEKCLQREKEMELKFIPYNLDDNNVINKVLNTRGFRLEHVNAQWSLLLHCNCVSPGLLSPTYVASNDVHVTSWFR
jgi:hypothetical protein